MKQYLSTFKVLKVKKYNNQIYNNHIIIWQYDIDSMKIKSKSLGYGFWKMKVSVISKCLMFTRINVYSFCNLRKVFAYKEIKCS